MTETVHGNSEQIWDDFLQRWPLDSLNERQLLPALATNTANEAALTNEVFEVFGQLDSMPFTVVVSQILISVYTNVRSMLNKRLLN